MYEYVHLILAYSFQVMNLKQCALDIHVSVHHDVIYQNDQQDATG